MPIATDYRFRRSSGSRAPGTSRCSAALPGFRNAACRLGPSRRALAFPGRPSSSSFSPAQAVPPRNRGSLFPHDLTCRSHQEEAPVHATTCRFAAPQQGLAQLRIVTHKCAEQRGSGRGTDASCSALRKRRFAACGRKQSSPGSGYVHIRSCLNG